MSSVREQFQYKKQVKLYKNNIVPLYSLNSIQKKTNVFELMNKIKLEKQDKAKSYLKFYFTTALFLLFVLSFYSLY